jgi:putative nucleotidyltransferase with HDIG domain
MVSPNYSIEDIIAKTKDLPTIPAAAVQVLRETELPTSNAASVARLLMQDQSLTTRVLRLSNSSYYGLSRQVSDLQEAVVILGMRTVRNLALVAGSYPWLNRPIKGYALEPTAMWQHSLGTAVGAQMVATKSRKCDPQLAFMCGLLHDLGKVVLAVWLENKLGAMMKLASSQNKSFHEVERQVLGFDHCDVGFHLATKWNLPEGFAQAMRYHHDPEGADPKSSLVDCIHMGDHMTMHMGLGLGGDGMRYEFCPEVMDRLGLSVENFEELLAGFIEEFQVQEAMFKTLV